MFFLYFNISDVYNPMGSERTKANHPSHSVWWHYNGSVRWGFNNTSVQSAAEQTSHAVVLFDWSWLGCEVIALSKFCTFKNQDCFFCLFSESFPYISIWTLFGQFSHFSCNQLHFKWAAGMLTQTRDCWLSAYFTAQCNQCVTTGRKNGFYYNPHHTIVDKNSAPSSLEWSQFETLFRSEAMPLFWVFEWINNNRSPMHLKQRSFFHF